MEHWKTLSLLHFLTAAQLVLGGKIERLERKERMKIGKPV